MDRVAAFGLMVACAAGASLIGAGQQGIGQTPSPLPLTQTVRERGSSVTPAFEGWYYEKDGTQRVLVGYFNRNTKQEFDIPPGPDNRVEPGGPDMGQPTHFSPGRQWGVFTIKLPKDFGDRKLTWTIVANGFTNSITLHTKSDYVVEPFEDAANKNTPPMIKFRPGAVAFTGPPTAIAENLNAVAGTPLPLIVWASDEGPTINVPEPGRGRGRGRGTDATAFTPPPPLALTWSMFRGPGLVKFDNAKPPIDKEQNGKASTTATFSAPGEYILRLQGNDSTGEGGGGFQCCWTNVHIGVSVKPAAGTGGQ
ncbi:MAG: hypothetical protein DMF98_12050 [Acidobacteria bacterium]|nr:MAG: hypothetical protein DMF98_12050 [Acidobacteriota bacterium]